MEKNYQIKLNQIICSDVVKTLSQLQGQYKFDVIIADPPYNIGKDFGNNHDNLPLTEYIDWSKDWLDKCFDVLSKNGIIYVYGFPEILAHIAVHYPIEKQHWLAWHYTNKTTPSSKFWQRSHESILCLWKSATRPKLEIDQIREPYSQPYLNCAGSVRKNTQSRFGKKETIYNAHENGALPRDVIKVPALAGGAGATERWFMCHDCNDEVFPPSQLKFHRKHEILKHPTQKPMMLTQRLIQSIIKGNQGNIFIPFAGSGSECIIAQNLGINFLATELNPIFADFGQKWLKLSETCPTSSLRGTRSP